MLTLHEIVLRLSFAALLGALIGIERDVHRRPAGIRTSAFVCLGSALFTILSFQLAKMYGDSSPTRIASNLVQGIGFLGAGAILREAGGLVGLTTAATIFVEAAIGMAVGGGLYAVGGYATALVLFGLIVIGWLMRVCNLKPRIMGYRVTASHAAGIDHHRGGRLIGGPAGALVTALTTSERRSGPPGRSNSPGGPPALGRAAVRSRGQYRRCRRARPICRR